MHFKLLALAAFTTTALSNPSLSHRQTTCEDQVNACRTAKDANQASCSADYAACLGYNPYTGTSPVATGVPEPVYPQNDTNPVYTNETIPVCTTEIVTAYTTFCPYPTTVVQGTKTYTATGPTYLTVTDCPCTISYYLPATTPGVGPGGVYTTPGSSAGAHSTEGAHSSPGSPATSKTTSVTGTTIPATAVATFTGAATVKDPSLGLAVLGAFALLL